MVFSSSLFLFIFLPIVLFGYYVSANKLKNIWLLIVSLFFYSWGEPKYIFLMLLSILINYIAGRFLDVLKSKKCRITILVIAIILNIITLLYFKYFNFIVTNFNSLLGTSISVKNIALPVGISFYTFQGLSYVVDVYRKDVKCQKNILDLGLYISFFPQLIAGPIVRYEDIEAQMKERTVSFDKFYSGIRRFMIGFSKKVLIADQLASLSDNIFASNGYSGITAWIGAIAYTLQIYFDFSGYSDMAIGLGKMFGFEFMENFNYPYISKSIKEFWRRWHISLSTWFKDYVYIPLGGSRCKPTKSYFNLIIVFLLTGFWHGASWNFVVWGLYYVVFLIIERLGFSKILDKLPVFVRYFYAMIIIIGGWVLFRADGLHNAILYYKNMFNFESSNLWIDVISNLNRKYVFFIIVGIIFSFPLGKLILKEDKNTSKFRIIINNILVFSTFILAIGFLLGSGFSPFLYFRF